MFGLNIDSMIVPFSLREWVKEWVDGKGLVEDAVGAGWEKLLVRIFV